MFDYMEYSRAMDNFLVKMEQKSHYLNADIHEELEEICGILEIAQIDAEFYENRIEESKGSAKNVCFYQEGNVNPLCVHKQRETAGSAYIAVYSIYALEGKESWSDIQLDKINVLIKTLFSFNGRAKATHVAGELMYKDSELGIYNLNYFTKAVNEIIEDGNIGKYGACYFDMKRVSIINDQLGRKTGTNVIKKYVNQLAEQLEPEDLVCRFGGDNFLVLFKKGELEIVKNYMLGAEVRYGQEEEDTILVTSYAGFYMIPDDCKNSTDIMDYMSMALQAARKSVETSFIVFFNEELLEYNKRLRMIDTFFPKALRQEEFKVYYQPKVDLKDYQLIGAEALCRWVHDGRLISPEDFIPVLENSNTICELDFYMLEHVCRDIRKWLDEGRSIVKVSVNLSRRNIRDEKLLKNILSIIDINRVPHEYIEIELTETTTDVDFEMLKRLVTELRASGISTSVDDFGTGYSSLNVLREIPWSVLKVDKSFLPEGDNVDEKKTAMLKFLIGLSKDMGYDCIVEGVETVEQLQLIKRNNCFLAQGYYFDKPLPVEKFEERLRSMES